jgi:thiazole synthase
VAGDPIAMADAFRQAVEAGRKAYKAGLGRSSQTASASSPQRGLVGESLDFLENN